MYMLGDFFCNLTKKFVFFDISISFSSLFLMIDPIYCLFTDETLGKSSFILVKWSDLLTECMIEPTLLLFLRETSSTVSS